jgi:putative ABC transport system substrate-binding protein
MKRRTFIAALGGAAAWPLVGRAQQPAMPVIGFMGIGSPEDLTDQVASFRQGLSEAGYVEGVNVAIEFRWANGRLELVPPQAAELVNRRVNVIVGAGTTVERKATTVIPIVKVFASDPAEDGTIASLNKPGGNVTGVDMRLYSLGTKRLELLREAMPNTELIAVLNNSANPAPGYATAFRNVQAAALTFGQRIIILNASSAPDMVPAFATMAQQRAGALLEMADPVFFNVLRKQIIALAARHALPAMYEAREFAEAGGLMSYGTDISDAFRRLGVYTGKVLAGANPAELPIDQAVRIELVLNLKTAKALGLTFPLSILARADEVIE